MAGAIGSMKGAFLADQSMVNPRLRPPSLVSVLFCLISTFTFICCMASFHLGPTTLILSFALVIFYKSLGTAEGSAYDRNYPSISFLIPISIGTALLPLYIGTKIYVAIYTPYHLAASGRTYENVSPTAHSAEFADAGIIRFTSDSTLDTSRSFGFQAEDFTYCAAPVVSREVEVHPDSSGPKISFWAVGKDCCGNRRDFECDGAGETEVKSAFTVKEKEKDALTKLLVPRTARPMYIKAVEAAMAMHNLKVENEDEIILVRWAAEPEKTLDVWYWRGVIAVAISCISYAVLVTVIWTGIHVYFDRQIKRSAQRLDVPSFTPPGRQSRFSFSNSPFGSRTAIPPSAV